MIIGIINDLSQKGTILILIGDIISLIAYCIYLEIIQFKCCNMNFNTRISINHRSKIESLDINFYKDDDSDDDDTITVKNNNTIKEMITIKGEDIDNNG